MALRLMAVTTEVRVSKSESPSRAGLGRSVPGLPAEAAYRRYGEADRE
jgi:hypothetical protein